MSNSQVSVYCVSVIVSLAACGGADSDAPSSESEPVVAGSAAAADECVRGTLEADFQGAPLAGPGVKDGALVAGDYVISSTYLRLRGESDAQMRFGQLMEPIMSDLSARSGLVALAFGNSQQCGTARTLSVWQDEGAMFGFVASEAHAAAVAAVREVSRGGSLVTHWAGGASDASWSTAVVHVGEDEGPLY